MYVENISIVKECILLENDKAVIELNNGNRISMLLMVSETGYPKQFLGIISCMDSDSYHVILAPYITEQTADICKDAGVGYLDMAGNCNIACDSLYVEVKGNKNENVIKRGMKSIYEKSSIVSSKILRVMMQDVSRVWKMKELSISAGCSLGQVAKVKDFLMNHAYINQSSEGISLADPKAVMKDWANVYSSRTEERVDLYSLDDIATLESKIVKMGEDLGIDCYLTGFSGGSRFQPVVRYNKLHAYIDKANLDKAMEYLGLKKVDSGANVIFLFPYDDCIKANSEVVNGNKVVSPVQIYLDCMGIKGRGEEMAQAILERAICK